MKLKLSQMKKISSDATHTTMETKEGHTLRIAHNSLSKDHKKALEALPMLESKKSDNENPKLEESKKVLPKAKMADGGQVAEAAPEAMPPSAPQPLAPAAAPQAPGAIPQAEAQPAMQTSTPGASPTPMTQDPAQAAVTPIDLTKGLNSQVQGIQEISKGEQAQAQAKADVLKTGIAAQQKISDDYQAANKHTQDELTGLRKAIGDGHIDPNHYLGSQNTLGRISTAVGVFLGGFGKGGNQVLDYVNKQIDNDIRAQQSNLDNKQTLYSAALKQSENQQQAANMARLSMNDMVLSKLQQAEASTSNPIIKGRAQQAIGVVQNQMAPLIAQQATYKLLQGGSDNIKNINPADLVPRLVPKEHQEAVYKEVERARNTTDSAAKILKQFDASADALKAYGGLGRIGAAIHEPREMAGLEADLGTTVGDLEGSVRQAAMENVKHSFKPQKDDTDSDLAKRREALIQYLHTKSAAPRFESYTHVPLSKFTATSQDPAINFTPQQKAYADYAKANPNAPGSQAVLKKLGLQ